MKAEIAGLYHHAEFQGFSDLRRLARDEAPEATDVAARQFEALFIQMMLKSMRDAAPGLDGGDSDQVGFYRDMFDQQIALELARGEGIGLRESLVRELSGGDVKVSSAAAEMRMPQHRVPAAAEPMSEAPPDAEAEAAPVGAGGTAGTPQPVGSGAFRSPDDFIHAMWPHAEAAGGELGVSPEVLLAQSALETGWGRHVMRQADGSSSHNLFGIKADPRWSGPRVHVQTLEYVDGVAERQRAAFRAYGSPAESFADYVDFLRGNPRYRHALEQAPDAEAFLRGLQEAGYATDPAYADKILDILNRGTLRRISELKSPAAEPTTAPRSPTMHPDTDSTARPRGVS